MGGSAPDEGCAQAHDVVMERAVVDLVQEGGVVDTVESFAVIYGDGCGAEGGLLLVETLGDSCCEREECCSCGV